MQRLPNLSPARKEQERYHIEKEAKLNHLRTPNQSQLSGYGVVTHIVAKKDGPMGRWVSDVRIINEDTIPEPISIGDTHSKVRDLAPRLYKTLMDLWPGFNQVENSEAAKRIPTLVTHSGLRQST